MSDHLIEVYSDSDQVKLSQFSFGGQRSNILKEELDELAVCLLTFHPGLTASQTSIPDSVALPLISSQTSPNR